MSIERKTHSAEQPRQPSYKTRRLGAGLIATAAIMIPVTGNTSEAVSIPVHVANTAAELVSEANDPKGREIPMHNVRFENAGGVEGGVFYAEQGSNQAKQETGIGTALTVYEVQPGDTASKIAAELFPEMDYMQVTNEMIDPQLPEADRKNHILRPGEVLKFERK